LSTLFRLRLPRQFYTDMVAQAQTELPNECCGLLAGTIVTQGGSRIGRVERWYPLVNASQSPVRYSAEKDLFAPFREMREAGLEHLAIYHSHPTTVPVPSKTDLAEWNYGPAVMCLIISLHATQPQMRGWWLTAEDYQEAEWELID
jgi:proteasome lid subunit RPN8/RPN11